MAPLFKVTVKGQIHRKMSDHASYHPQAYGKFEKFSGPKNTSGASQQNRVAAALSSTTEVHF